nr:zinc finger, CCHC-type [Tanacetum cinerariifolium]
MMSQTTLSKSFWNYALETAARILNMVLTKKVEKTPYEVWHRKAPKLSYLKVWGWEALVKRDTLTKSDKLEPRSIKCIFTGYPKEMMGYSFYYPPKNKVLVARITEFLNNSLINQEASRSLEDLEIIQKEDTHPSMDTSLNHEEDDLEIDEPQSDIIPIRRSTRTRHASDRMCLYIDAEEHELGDLGEPVNHKATLLDPESEKWLNVEMQSMKDNEVWVLVELPPNGKTIGSKWLFKKKTDMDGVVHTYKAHLVAKGYTQTPGIDYEETFSPVADIRAIRILITIVVYYDYEIWQMDVKNAVHNVYLNEEVYMEQPEGFVNPKYPNRRYCIENSKRECIPMQEKLKLSKSQGASTPAELKHIQNVPYASVVGSIMYAVRCTRPDVAFAQNKSAKQSIFTTSSAEAEYIVAFDASKEAVWVRKYISGLGVVPTIEEPISMYCDNTGAIAIANESGITKDDNLADPFTKALAFLKHSEHTRNIGMLPASSLMGFFKKQKLTGPNFIDWYRQLRIVLSIEDKLNYLDQLILPAPVVPAETLDAHEMLLELKTMFAQQAEHELLQTTRDFYSCKQEEGQSVSSYVLKIKGYIDNLERLKHPVTLGLGVNLILIDLSKEFDGFVQNYNMHSLGKTINELHAMLKLHEQTLPKNNTPTIHAIRASKVQKVNKHKKSQPQWQLRDKIMGGKNKQAYAPKPTISPPPKREDPTKDSICHECGETGHLKRNCPQYLAEFLKKKKNAASGAGGLGIFVIERNTILNRSWIYDTGYGTHICNTTQGLRASRKLKPGALSFSIYAVSNKRVKLDLDSALLWHCRLGHISKKRIEKLQHDGLLDSTNLKDFEKCVSCISRKISRKPYTHQVERAKDLLRLIHTDRRNRTLLDMVRSMMSQITLPKSFWDYALETGARILNMIPSKKVEKTPYEVWYGKAPKLSYLKV